MKLIEIIKRILAAPRYISEEEAEIDRIYEDRLNEEYLFMQ